MAYYVLPTTNQCDFIWEYLRRETIVVTAARNVGEKSPLLIDANSLKVLPAQAVLVDLSTGEGGNIIGSKHDEVVVVERGILIVNVSGYPKMEPRAASEAYAQCMLNLLVEIITVQRQLELNSNKHQFILQKPQYLTKL